MSSETGRNTDVPHDRYASVTSLSHGWNCLQYPAMLSKLGVRPKILVVDDEPEAVELIEFNLKQAGYDVVTAADGAEAIKKSRSAVPSLIILDLMLPEIDGLEVCK